ncbi:MAG: phosphopyruvate hydratase [Chloroflexi bacterium]|jgi:enolase|nr:phosphopyruvate hydratase [Chloroflexota bacterium]MDP6063341.1 phosphopyruvate hydratase [SAR202 cluster bacterium]HAL47654.1 phosphopyruvate hydratase [Dehalococcoidia bacterium]|tara:strand:- start:2069 stop:3364 length:1296 start_codon:yes stop_codon:yes gene_type:complete
MTAIAEVKAREVLDSRANPTVEVDVVLSDGALGRALVPSGASTGEAEALELRDGDSSRYGGRGVLKAVDNVRTEIADAVMGVDPLDQAAIDDALKKLDGTPDKSRLGANAILGVSLAVARAAAQSAGQPLYAYMARDRSVTLPVPMLNVINGGRHAENSTDFQEFMIVPAGFDSFSRALQAGIEVYHALKSILSDRNLGTLVGDEGGFAPAFATNEAPVEILIEAIEKAGYISGQDCFLAMDVAASEFAVGTGGYNLVREGRRLSTDGLIDLYEEWLANYPALVSIEDGLTETDWTSWAKMTSRLGTKVQLVGDDLLTTNPDTIRQGVEQDAGNAVLIKFNQIGTLSETLEAIRIAHDAGWGTVISHRSGETEDTSIADLAVGVSAGQIKAGAPARGERTAKYNRLLRIEDELGDKAIFAGSAVYSRFTSR